MRRASAPLGASADQDDTIRVQTRCGPSINPSHVDSGSHTRLFVMGGHGELKLLAQAMRELPNSELLDFRPLANGSQDVSFGQGAAPGARLPLRSSCEPFGVPLIHTYHSSVNIPGTIY